MQKLTEAEIQDILTHELFWTEFQNRFDYSSLYTTLSNQIICLDEKLAARDDTNNDLFSSINTRLFNLDEQINSSVKKEVDNILKSNLEIEQRLNHVKQLLQTDLTQHATNIINDYLNDHNLHQMMNNFISTQQNFYEHKIQTLIAEHQSTINTLKSQLEQSSKSTSTIETLDNPSSNVQQTRQSESQFGLMIILSLLAGIIFLQYKGTSD